MSTPLIVPRTIVAGNSVVALLPSAAMASASDWTLASIPPLAGARCVVTGANSGIGYFAALELARHGAQVLLACRNTAKGSEAAARIQEETGATDVDVMALDLADLSSVRAFADALRDETRAIDLLINNAGVMAIPKRAETADGFEMQFGTNHLGHFALTGLLLDRLRDTPGARIITVSSNAHRMAKIRFEDPNWEREYSRWAAYGQSKLANLMFAYELQRRLARAGAKAISVACHPGWSATSLLVNGSQLGGGKLFARVGDVASRVLAQDAAAGALPTLYAATQPGLRGGEYVGPDGFQEMRGKPHLTGSTARSRHEEDAARLWELSERLTGVRYLS